MGVASGRAANVRGRAKLTESFCSLRKEEKSGLEIINLRPLGLFFGSSDRVDCKILGSGRECTPWRLKNYSFQVDRADRENVENVSRQNSGFRLRAII